jgi:medium-chain acyl-[acyl-carrier-protein] hydrolase
MFEHKIRVDPFMTNRNKTLSPVYLFHFINDIMEKNASSYGAGAAFHLKQNLAWVLIEYEITIHRMPLEDEDIYVGTLPYSFKKMIGYRVYQIRTMSNEVLVEGKGKFMLIDIVSKALKRPSQEMLDKFTDALKEPATLDFKKVHFSKTHPILKSNRQVNHTYIDINNHMNNAYYPALAYESLGEDIANNTTFKMIKVYYKKEAFVLDELVLTTYQEDQGYLVTINHQEDLCAEIFFQVETKA